jgi:SAM-dependent methyltransferase
LDVTAVEPVDEMRAVLERVVPDIPALAGTAEAIPAPAGSFDGVTVAQAFHWFDAPAAYAEVRRVIRKGGVLIALWNLRDENDELSAAFSEQLDRYRGGDYPGTRGVPETDLFDFSLREFPHAQLLDADGLVERAASVSFVAALPDHERAGLLARVRQLAPQGLFEFPYVTKVFTGHSR